MIIDNHVHVGWFTDGYHTPREVWDSAVAAGIDGMAVSSTSTCTELYKVVVREMRELIKLGGERVHPILWLTPKMMKCRYALPYMLHSKIPWQGIKMHWEAHKEWANNKKLVVQGLELARQLGVPVLLHTGNFVSCHAGLFADIIAENQDLTFVLAHGRPLDETLEVVRNNENSFIDTSFMPAQDLQQLVDKGLVDRILFGTDFPINEVFYKDINSVTYIQRNIEMIKSVCGKSADDILSRCIY